MKQLRQLMVSTFNARDKVEFYLSSPMNNEFVAKEVTSIDNVTDEEQFCSIICDMILTIYKNVATSAGIDVNIVENLFVGFEEYMYVIEKLLSFQELNSC